MSQSPTRVEVERRLEDRRVSVPAGQSVQTSNVSRATRNCAGGASKLAGLFSFMPGADEPVERQCAAVAASVSAALRVALAEAAQASRDRCHEA